MGNAGRDEAFPARASRRMTVKDTAATLLRPRDIDGFDLCCLLPFWLRSPGLCHSFFSALLPSRSPASARVPVDARSQSVEVAVSSHCTASDEAAEIYGFVRFGRVLKVRQLARSRRRIRSRAPSRTFPCTERRKRFAQRLDTDYATIGNRSRRLGARPDRPGDSPERE